MTHKTRPSFGFILASVVAFLIALAIVIVPLIRALAFMSVAGLIYITRPPKLKRQS